MNVLSRIRGEFCFFIFIFILFILLTSGTYSNIYTRRVLTDEFQIVCPWLLKDLVERGLWDDTMHNQIIANNSFLIRIRYFPKDAAYRKGIRLRFRNQDESSPSISLFRDPLLTYC